MGTTNSTPHRPGPREADVGFLIAQARTRNIYVHERGQLVDLQCTKSKRILFTGTPVMAADFLKRRTQ